MDPLSTLQEILSLAEAIYSLVQLSKANQKQSTRLAKRIKIVTAAIQGLKELPKTQQFLEALNALRGLLNEIKQFVEQFSEVHWFKKILFAGSHSEKFAKFTQQLAECLTQLNVGLSAQQLINREEDRKDEAADRAFLLSKVDEILALQEKTLREVQKARLDMPQLEAIIKKQLQSVEQHLRQYAQPPNSLPPRLLPKDCDVNFCEVEFTNKIGEGSFGSIYAGSWRKQPVAIKQIEGIVGENDRQQFIREAQIMSRLHSEFITAFRGACFEEKRLCLLMELMEKGDLEKLLPSLSLAERLQMAQDLARGLHYLHEQGVIHGDIKLKNALVNRHNQAKWTDFGLSKTHHNSIATITEVSQEARWQAPESWQHRAELSPASDVYSFGMVLWALMSGRIPYVQYKSDDAIIQYINAGQREVLDEAILPECRDLIQRCWLDDPNKRPKTAEIVDRLMSIQLRPASPSGEALYERGVNEMNAQHYSEAYPLFERAAQKQCAKAFTNLGLFALQGLGGRPVNKASALAFLQKGAEAGHSRAAFNLGRMYEKGDGVTQDYPTALKYYQQALATNPQDKPTQAKVELLLRLVGAPPTEGYAFATKH